MITVTAAPFAGLDGPSAYAVWKLRQDVFVVEQACPYPDLDGRDDEPDTRHVLLRDDALPGARGLLGYARVLDDRQSWRIGRVAVARAARGRGLADHLMNTALEVSQGRDVVLKAQSPLTGWYASFGFEVDGVAFLEDGIPHVPMRLSR